MKVRIKRIIVASAMAMVTAMGLVVVMPADAAVNDITTVTAGTQAEAERLAQARCRAAAWPGTDVLAVERTTTGVKITYVCD